jgi:hypothetical protein
VTHAVAAVAGLKHPRTVPVLNDLASLLQDRGDLGAAAAFDEAGGDVFSMSVSTASWLAGESFPKVAPFDDIA